MIILYQVIHDKKTNSIEATWINSDGHQVKSHSYADVQMQIFRSDVAELGGNIAEYEQMISVVESAIVPPPAPTADEIKKIAIREGLESSVSGDSIIKSLKGMDQNEFDAWWTANVNNAAQAIGLLKRLVRILLLRVL